MPSHLKHLDNSQLTIAIIGAGIAGLSAARAFAKTGAIVHIFEKAEELLEIGASVQLSPNATRILRELDLTTPLTDVWTEPHSVRLTDARSLKVIAEVPVSELSKNVWNAPYAILRRAALQTVLSDAIVNDPNCHLHLNCSVAFDSERAFMDDLTDKIGKKPDLIIGADGIWSSTRNLLWMAGKPKYSKYIAWRFNADITARAHLPSEISNSRSVHVLMGSANHTAIYPADENGSSNVIFVSKSKDETKDHLDITSELSRHALNEDAVHMLTASHQLGCWPIYEVSDGAWSNNENIVLIGDAAHAMMPFMAQGAGMAIEDGYVLANMVAESNGNVKSAIIDFEIKRKFRILKVKSRTAFNRFAYHAIGPIRWGRDFVLSRKSPASLGRGLDWLYGWKPDD